MKTCEAPGCTRNPGGNRKYCDRPECKRAANAARVARYRAKKAEPEPGPDSPPLPEAFGGQSAAELEAARWRATPEQAAAITFLGECVTCFSEPGRPNYGKDCAHPRAAVTASTGRVFVSNGCGYCWESPGDPGDDWPACGHPQPIKRPDGGWDLVVPRAA